MSNNPGALPAMYSKKSSCRRLINGLAGLFMLLSPAAPNLAMAGVSLEYSNQTNPYILISGLIEVGDFDAFIEAARKAHEAGHSGLLDVVVSSLGGNVVEAMRIGRAIRQLRISVTGPRTHLMKGIDLRCQSACFFIWVSAVDRAGGGGLIGIHRPRLPRSYYRNLSSTEAAAHYEQLTALTRAYLEEMGVATRLIEHMYQVPADEIYVLTPEEVTYFGLNDAVPAYDEWIAAKCGVLSKEDIRDLGRLKNPDDHDHGFSAGYQRYLNGKWEQNLDCEWAASRQDRQSAAAAYFGSGSN